MDSPSNDWAKSLMAIAAFHKLVSLSTCGQIGGKKKTQAEQKNKLSNTYIVSAL